VAQIFTPGASDHRDVSCPVLTNTSPSSPDASSGEKPAHRTGAVFQFTTSVLLASILTVCVISVLLSLSIHVDYVKALAQIGEFVCMASILLIHLHAANLSLPSVRSLPNGALASSSAFIVS
jgi:hypothetical protein